MSAHENHEIASRLEEMAALLAEQGANPFRSRAYRRAASTIAELEQPVSALLEHGGDAALQELPGVGPSIARAIREIVLHGRMPMLDRLRGESDPVAVLMSVAGIGHALAERLHHELGIGTLEELEMAAHDGRLAALHGFGPRRIAAIRDMLGHRLARLRTPAARPAADEPPVAELLDVDREYRERAARGELRTIAPRRFNPRHEAWLPVMHAERGNRHYTALFSNTARAHQMGRTRDWVVLYQDDGGGEDRQCTVITAERGPLAGRRIVRGREAECAEHYRILSAGRGDRARSERMPATPQRGPAQR